MSEIMITSFEDFKVQDNKKKDTKGKVLKVVFAILLVLLFVEAIVYIFVFPCLNNVKINFYGLNNCTRQEIGNEQASHTECRISCKICRTSC